MANSLVLVFLLPLLESTIGTLPFQQCCPEDNENVFNQRDKICNSSHALGVSCKNNSETVEILKNQHVYWLRESDGAAVFGSEYFSMVISHESFCVANITSEATSRYGNSGTIQQFDEGIVLCNDTSPSDTYLGPEPLGYAVCILISGICCFLTFLTYTLVPELRRDLLNKCIICALFCFTFTYLAFGITLIKMHWLSHHYCVYQLLFLLFWATTAAFWTNVISFEIWRSVVFKHFPLNEAQLLKIYHFWGWGVPLILSLIGINLEAFSIGSGIGFLVCQIDSVYAVLVMLLPYPFLLFFNLLYFIWAICKLWRQEVPSNSSLKVTRFQKLQYKSHLYLKLFLLMGIPWIICIVTMFPRDTFIRIVLNSLTVLQGLFLFLLLVVFQRKALLGLAEQFTKWGCACCFVTTNVAVILHEEGDDEDDNNIETGKDAVKSNTQ